MGSGARLTAESSAGGTGRPLRILVVNWLDRENPRSGGAEIHLHEIFGRMVRAGHEVSLLCSGWEGLPGRARLDGIDVHRVGRRYTFSLHARRHFRRTWDPDHFDVIVEDLNKIPLHTPRWSDRPVVLLVHHLFGGTAFQEANLLLATATWILERPVPRRFRGVPTIAISESTREDLVQRGLPTSQITVIENGIDVDLYRPDPGTVRYAEPTLVFLGRLKRYKRIDLVLRALALLQQQGVTVRLLIAGKGDDQDRLERLRDHLGLRERVEFLGFVDLERKLEILRRSWAHVLTSPKEGWGISNVEAAACGTPTVASDSPGLRESVLHGETGYLVPHGDVAALASHVERITADPDLLERLGANARTYAERFSWDASARRVLAVLAEAVQAR